MKEGRESKRFPVSLSLIVTLSRAKYFLNCTPIYDISPPADLISKPKVYLAKMEGQTV